MTDIERLDKALAWIEKHPELHDQGVWLRKVDCGTAGCLAGWIAVQEHPAAVFAQDCHDIGDTYSMVQPAPGAEPRYVDRVARDLLGLTQNQADELFDGDNTLADLKGMRDLLAADAKASAEYLRMVRVTREMAEEDDDPDDYDLTDGE